MNGTSGFQERWSTTSRSPSGIGSCTSNSINSEQVPGTFSVLTISSFSAQEFAQSEKRFLTPFSVHLVIVLGLAVLFLSACARVGVVVEGGATGSVQEPYIFPPDDPKTQPQGPRCQLNGIANRLQETSVWCWAASAQVVIEYLRLASAIPGINQCDLVHAVFEGDLRARENDPDDPLLSGSLNCCKTNELPPSNTDPDRISKIESTRICLKTHWSNRVFDTFAYKHGYSTVYYNPDSAKPQGLGWEDLVAQICDNRPFIFAIRWGGGGGHTAVVGGYRQSAAFNRWVEVYDPGYSNASYDFYVMRYKSYLGVPGDFTRDRDYINILPQ